MQSALKLSSLLLCLSFTIADGRPSGLAVAKDVLLAGCPATAIVCPDPKPATESTSKPPKKVQKDGKS